MASGNSPVLAGIDSSGGPSSRLRRGSAGAVLLACLLGAVAAIFTPLVFRNHPAPAGIAKVQTGPVSGPNASSNVTVTLSSASTAGNLLVATLDLVNPSCVSFTGPGAGWTKAVAHCDTFSGVDTEIWYYANNPGALTTATFTSASGTATYGVMTEWSGVAATALDTSASSDSAASSTLTTSASASAASTGELAVTAFGVYVASASSDTFTPGASWSNIANDGTTSVATVRFTNDYRAGNGAGAVSETETGSIAGEWTNTVALFKPKQNSLSIDFTAAGTPNYTWTMPSFSTKKANTFLVALVERDGPQPGVASTLSTVSVATGVAPVWSLASSVQTQGGTTEVWTSSTLTAAATGIVIEDVDTSKAALDGQLTILGLTVSGGASMASAGTPVTASGVTPGSSVAVSTTSNNSLVYAAGNDSAYGVTRVPAAGQRLHDQWLSTNGDTYWDQYDTSSVATSGTVITMSDTSADGATPTPAWNMVGVEIKGDGVTVPSEAIHLSRPFPSNVATQATSPVFATSQPDELVVATVASDCTACPVTSASLTTLSGPRLNWTKAVESNAQSGTAAIWWAIVPQPTPNLSFVANLTSGAGDETVTVTGILGADPSAPIGPAPVAASQANLVNNTQTISVTTTRDNSWVWGVGEDWWGTSTRTPGTGTLISETTNATTSNNDQWVQANEANGAPSGTVLQLTDTSNPISSNDGWDYAAVEIRAATLGSATVARPTTTANPSSSGTVTLSDTVSGSLGTPTGNVTFYDGDPTGLPGAPSGVATNLGTAALSAGTATLAVTLGAGNHTIFASYAGDTTYSPGVSTELLQAVYKMTPLSVAGWGMDDTSLGQLGDGGGGATCGGGTHTCREYPIQVNSVGNAVQVAAAFDSSYALDSTGHVWGWGDNANGQLGQGSTSSAITTPVEVCASGQTAPCTTANGKALSGIIALGAGEQSGWALTTAGTLYAWGVNSYGSLCDGTTTQRTAPVLTSIGGATIVSISTRHHEVAMVTSTGAVYVCGGDATGQVPVGLATTDTAYSTPTLMTLLPPVKMMAVGEDDAFALAYNGTVLGWGHNQNGDLANGRMVEDDNPTAAGTDTNVVSLAAGELFAAEMLNGGSIKVVGDGTHSEIGNGAALNQTAFTATTALAHPAIAMSVSQFGVIVQESDFSIWDWGDNGGGQVGDNTVTDRAVPTAVHGFNNAGTLNPGVATVVNGGVDSNFVLTPATATTTVTSSADPAPAGGSVTLTARVTGTGAIPTGTVTFQDGSGAIAGCSGVAFSGTGGISVDSQVAADISVATTGFTTPAISAQQGDVLVAFVGSTGSAPVTVTGVSGGGLTWTLAKRTNANSGTAEIWTAVTPVSLSSSAITATVSASNTGSIVVTAFKGVNENAPVGASAGASATTGAESVTVTPLTTGSVVWGVGFDSTAGISRTAAAGQAIQHQYTGGTTTWVQNATAATATGTPVVLSDTGSPTTDSYNWSAVELQPPAAIATATCTTSSLAVGSHGVTATFTPADTNYTATAPLAAQPNAISASGLDPTFESGVANWGAYQSTISQVALGNAPDGTDVAKVTYASGTSYSIDGGVVATGVPAGTLYTAYAYVEAASPSAVGKQITVALREQAPGGAQVHAQESTYVTLTTSFQEIAVSWTDVYPGDGLDFYVDQFGAVAGDAFYVDKVGVYASPNGFLAQQIYPHTGATAFGWGDNSTAQLGDGTTTSRSYRMPVSTLGATVTQISGNYGAAAAIDTAGNAWVWGYSNHGQAGAAGGNVTTPFKILGTGNVVAISMSGSDNGDFGHVIALESDGSVWTWGDNTYGELGNATTDTAVHATPVQVTNVGNVVAVATTFYGDAVVKSDGTVWTWGGNGDGELGNGLSSCGADPCTGGTIPAEISTLTGMTQVSADGEWFLALKSDGTAWSWGRNNDGQLGNAGAGVACGTDTCETSPVQVSGVSGAASVHAARQDGYALSAAGAVSDWGGNYCGELGTGNAAKQTTAVPMSEESIPVTAIGGGYDAAVL